MDEGISQEWLVPSLNPTTEAAPMDNTLRLEMQMQRPEPTTPRPIFAIARDIREVWPKPYFGAVPYLDAMGALTKASDHYGCDDAKGIVLYFLANAQTFRGPKAKALKAELKAIVGD